MGMFDDLPAPFMASAIKVWPCASRPGFQWFIAWEGRPYYFRSRNDAILFAKDRCSVEDHEGLCD
jgi:hypothetical protein